MNKSTTLKRSEAAAYLNVSPGTLLNWEEKGILVPYRYGIRGDRRYDIRDLEKFKQEGLNK